MANKKVNIDADFVDKVQDLIKVCGSGNTVAKICGVTSSFISMIKSGRVKKISQETYERFNLLFGKSLEEIEAVQDEVLKKLKAKKESEAKKDKKLADKKQEEMLAMDKRVSDIKVGKRYQINFYPDQTGKKLKHLRIVEGEVIEIYKRFFLVQTKNFKITVLKKEVKYGLVTMVEVWKYK